MPWLVWLGGLSAGLRTKPKSHQFDSQPGHTPGLRTRSPVGGVREAATR